MSRLLMVTANHPFVHNGGETMFVAPELEQLVAAGWQVRLAPLHALGERQPLPAGVQLDLGLAASLRRGRAGDLLAAARWPGFVAEFGRAARQGGITGLARVWRWAAQAQAAWRWAATLPADAPTLAYTYWRGGATLALSRLAAQRPGWSAVTRVHGYDLYEDRFKPPFQPWTSVYSSLDRIFTVSQHGLDHLRGGGLPASRLTLARMGTAATVPSRPSGDGVLRVLSVSFLEQVKRVPLLAEALASLARSRGTPVEWTHLGDGPDMPRVRQALTNAPANLQARLRGRLTHDQVLAHYAADPVDAFVLVSASEGLPVSVQEALAAGVPVVATDVGGTREAVDDAVGRLLAADADATRIAEAIAAVAAAPALRAAARARWAERFDARCNHRAFAQRLQQVAAAAAGTPR